MDGQRVAKWLDRHRTPAELAASLKRDGVTHVLVHIPKYAIQSDAPVEVLERETLLQVSPRTNAMVQEFTREHAHVVYRDAQYLIFEVQ